MLQHVVCAALLVCGASGVLTGASNDTETAESSPVATRRDAHLSDSYGVPVPPNAYGPPSDFSHPPPGDVYGPPEITISLPKPVYGPPKDTYGPPKDTYGPPKDTYGPPKDTYGPPKDTYGPPKDTYGPPRDTYGPPIDTYGPPPKPKPVYGPPKPVYGPPKPVYGPPKPVYGPPKPVYGLPKPIYGPPKDTYGPPSKPKPVYGPPKPVYGPPKPVYGPPKPVYGPPKVDFISDSYGPPPKPKPSYGPPKPVYGPPDTYGPPAKPILPPKPVYGPPKPPTDFYGPPKPSFVSLAKPVHNSPKPVYGPPSISLPKPVYGAPSSSHHHHHQHHQSHHHHAGGAPPTPPEITYDGWRPIPGVSLNPSLHSSSGIEAHSIHLGGHSGDHTAYVEEAISNQEFTLGSVSSHIESTGHDVSFGDTGCCGPAPQLNGHSSNAYLPPSPTYGVPTSDIGVGGHSNVASGHGGATSSVSISHGASIESHGSIHGHLTGPGGDYSGPPPPKPSDHYGPPPKTVYGVPKPSYGAPSIPSHPKPSYGPPSNSYPPPPPSGSYGVPSGHHNPSSSSYDVPSDLTPPSGSYGPPSGPPSGSYGPPSGHQPPSGSYGPPSEHQTPPSGSYIPPSGHSSSSGSYLPPSGHSPPSGSYLPPSGLAPPSGSYGAPDAAVGTIPCCGTPPPDFHKNPTLGLDYGVPSGKQIEGPNLHPTVPVKFREPVPKGLIQAIGESAEYKNTGHGRPFHGEPYIPPSVPEVPEDKLQHLGDVPNHSVPFELFGPPAQDFQISPSVDLSPPRQHHQTFQHSAPAAPSGPQSYDGGHTDLTPPSEYGAHSQPAADLANPDTGSLLQGLGLGADSEITQSQSLYLGSLRGNDIPIHGNRGSYSLQIQAAPGSMPHDHVLTDGLLQDIIAAIEQEPSKDSSHSASTNEEAQASPQDQKEAEDAQDSKDVGPDEASSDLDESYVHFKSPDVKYSYGTQSNSKRSTDSKDDTKSR